MIEEKRNEPTVEKTEANTDSVYMEAIKELKENTVSKADYEKILKERDNILKQYINEKPSDNEVVVIDSKEQIKADREDLYTDKVEGLANLDYWKKTIRLRQNVINSGKPDPSLPMKGSTAYDEELSEKVFDVVQECIDECNDDPAVFNALLSKRTR